jgi:hypothetical protein
VIIKWICLTVKRAQHWLLFIFVEAAYMLLVSVQIAEVEDHLLFIRPLLMAAVMTLMKYVTEIVQARSSCNTLDTFLPLVECQILCTNVASF